MWTCATYLNMVADQIHLFMTVVFPGGSGLFQQDNTPYHTAHIVQEWFEEHDLSSRFKNSLHINLIDHLWDVLHLTNQGLEGPAAANFLVPDTTGGPTAY